MEMPWRNFISTQHETHRLDCLEALRGSNPAAGALAQEMHVSAMRILS